MLVSLLKAVVKGPCISVTQVAIEIISVRNVIRKECHLTTWRFGSICDLVFKLNLSFAVITESVLVLMNRW